MSGCILTDNILDWKIVISDPPSILMQLTVSECSVSIIDKIFGRCPSALISFRSIPLSTKSHAAFRLTLATWSGRFYSILVWASMLRVRICFTIHLLGMNSLCSWRRFTWMRGLMWLNIICTKTFPETDRKVMPLKLEQSIWQSFLIHNSLLEIICPDITRFFCILFNHSFNDR